MLLELLTEIVDKLWENSKTNWTSWKYPQRIANIALQADLARLATSYRP